MSRCREVSRRFYRYEQNKKILNRRGYRRSRMRKREKRRVEEKIYVGYLRSQKEGLQKSGIKSLLLGDTGRPYGGRFPRIQ